MNLHCEHHMYAAVQRYNLRKLAKHIEYDLPEAKSFFGTWKEMLEIRRRQKEDSSYRFDRPLPPTATQAP
jgi:fatty acid desaturase